MRPAGAPSKPLQEPTADGLDPRVFAELLAESLRLVARSEGVRFIALNASKHVFTASELSDSAPPSIEFSAHGLLTRWLRVNDRALVVPHDKESVWDDLSAEDQAALSSMHARLCVPMVADESMDAFFVVTDSRPKWTAEPAIVTELLESGRRAARGFQDVVKRHAERQATTAAFRSQQLTTTGHLAASVAHEVRNPLAAIRSIVQLVREIQPPKEKQQTLLKDVIDEVDRIERTVSGLLGVAQAHQMKIEKINMGTLAIDAVRFIEARARQLGVTFSTQLTANLWVAVDPRQFRQVLLNVILNACEACSHNGTVVVTTETQVETPAGFGVVRVIDNGSGISVRDLPRVFDPFFTTKSTGTGLGLAVSRDLLRTYGGDLTIESTVGEGTIVSLRLPLVDPGHGAHPRS